MQSIIITKCNYRKGLYTLIKFENGLTKNRATTSSENIKKILEIELNSQLNGKNIVGFVKNAKEIIKKNNMDIAITYSR